MACMIGFIIKPRLAFPEENNSSMRKISKLDDPAQYSRLGLVVRSFSVYVLSTKEKEKVGGARGGGRKWKAETNL